MNAPEMSAWLRGRLVYSSADKQALVAAADLIDAQQATIDEQAAEIARLNRIVLTADAVIERLAGQPCKYVATDPEGTSYCTLNGRASDGGDL